jgi:phage tail P2-like protein
MADFVSLLPRNSTAVELQIEQTLSRKYQHHYFNSCDSELISADDELLSADNEYLLDQLDADIIRCLQQPDECPLNLLPWLAYALSVDAWDDDWTEQVKRDVISQSVAIHRKKGTLGAVKSAIRAIGINDFEIKERSDNPAIAHGYFWLNFFADEPAINSQFKQRQLLTTIDGSKKLSAHYQAFLTAQGNVNNSNAVELLPVLYDRNIAEQFARLNLKSIFNLFTALYERITFLSCDTYGVAADNENLSADCDLWLL